MTLGVGKPKPAPARACERCSITPDPAIAHEGIANVWGKDICFNCWNEWHKLCPKFGSPPLGSWTDDPKKTEREYTDWTAKFVAGGA